MAARCYISRRKRLYSEIKEELQRIGYTLKQRGYIGRADCIRIEEDGKIEAAPIPSGDDTAGGF